jgi:hypothetical protein
VRGPADLGSETMEAVGHYSSAAVVLVSEESKEMAGWRGCGGERGLEILVKIRRISGEVHEWSNSWSSF